jgi:hypothetical protein
MTTQANSMLLVGATWNNKKTFKLIPISKEAPYIEAIYDKESKVFVIISKDTKTALHMLPSLDEAGAPIKITKGAHAGKPRQERRQIEVFMEYYLENKEDISNVISNLAINQSFAWQDFLVEEKEEKKKVEKK